MVEEIRRALRLKIIKEIYGDDWKPSHPLNNIGGLISPILSGQGTPAHARYLAGLIDAAALFDDVLKELGETPTPSKD